MKFNIRVLVLLCAILVCLTANAQNIALNKTTYTSSLENGAQYPGSSAVDGQGTGSQINSSGACASGTCTRWSSAFSDPQWIFIDLGRRYSITKVILYWESANGKNFQIQVSNDSTTWTPVQTFTGNTAFVNTTTLSGVLGRYVRMYGTARNTTYGYSLWEFEVYGAVSILPIHLLDFSAYANKEGVKLDWKASLDRPSDFQVERSSDAVNFSTIGFLTTNAGTPDVTNYSFQDAYPIDGEGYYRLRYKEKWGGAVFYSKVVAVSTPKSNHLAVYPNPLKGNVLHVSWPQSYSGPLEVVLATTTGVVITHQLLQTSNSKGVQIITKAGLPAGVYWLALTKKGSVEHLKIMMQ